MGITIPEEELELCSQLMRPAWIAAGLTNDLFSWEKEYEAAKRNHQPDVVNAIWVLVREHSITVDQAKDLCRQKIKVAVADYLQTIKETCNNVTISMDLRRYIEAMQYSLSGNVVWSLQCPRYHPEAQYNELQLLRMKQGSTACPKIQ
jgi:Terpene synthase family 2, C-terminal metal binding